MELQCCDKHPPTCGGEHLMTSSFLFLSSFPKLWPKEGFQLVSARFKEHPAPYFPRCWHVVTSLVSQGITFVVAVRNFNTGSKCCTVVKRSLWMVRAGVWATAAGNITTSFHTAGFLVLLLFLCCLRTFPSKSDVTLKIFFQPCCRTRSLLFSIWIWYVGK